MMSRVRAADDFETIRVRLEELRRERARLYEEGPVTRSAASHAKAAVRQPAAAERRLPLALGRHLRTQLWKSLLAAPDGEQ
jgi:hypothetical protein